MSTTKQRQTLRPLIAQAVLDGARLAHACTQIGLSARTVQRWRQPCALPGACRVGGSVSRVLILCRLAFSALFPSLELVRFE
jgi:hypothetical protein